jgi:hypothetical protein
MIKDKESKMGGDHSTHRRDGICIKRMLVGKLKGICHLRDLSIDGAHRE